VHRFERARRRGPGRGKFVWRQLPRADWEMFPGQHEAIIEAGQWHRVQAILARRLRRPRRVDGHAFLLSRLLRCPHCGGPMHGSHVSVGGNRYPTYRCTAYTHTRGCRPVCRSAHKWERIFLKQLHEMLAGTAAMETWCYRPDPVDESGRRLQAELHEITRRREALEEAVEVWSLRGMPIERLAARMQRLDAREAEVREQLSNPLAPPADPPELEGICEILRAPDVPVGVKRAVLADCIERIEFAGEDRLRLSFLCP